MRELTRHRVVVLVVSMALAAGVLWPQAARAFSRAGLCVVVRNDGVTVPYKFVQFWWNGLSWIPYLDSGWKNIGTGSSTSWCAGAISGPYIAVAAYWYHSVDGSTRLWNYAFSNNVAVGAPNVRETLGAGGTALDASGSALPDGGEIDGWSLEGGSDAGAGPPAR